MESSELDAGAEMVFVGAPAARSVLPDQIQRTFQQRHAGGLDRDDAPAGARHLGRVADQSEASDIGARVNGPCVERPRAPPRLLC